MATFVYENLLKKYEDFHNPRCKVFIDGKDFNSLKGIMDITDLKIENTCEYKASMAAFQIIHCFDKTDKVFKYKDMSKVLKLGAVVVIYIGYNDTIREVFRGFISNVSFNYFEGEVPGIRVTCLDIKGIMMSGSYVRQLSATCYSDAVKEILSKTNYEKLTGGSAAGGLGGLGGMAGGLGDLAGAVPGMGGNSQAPGDTDKMITSLQIADTPDKQAAGGIGGTPGGQQKVTDKTIEMVAESDYEFVVKAGKKFNYEFFTNAGTVVFRKAKDTNEVLIELDARSGIYSIDMTYDITGLASKVEVRGMDVGKNKLIKSTKKLSNKISNGNIAKSLISGVEKDIVDPTITSEAEAGYRADYIAEDIAYRLGSLNLEMIGLPELTPGFFVKIKILDNDYAVKFYMTDVIHRINKEGDYSTTIIGKSSSVDKV